MNKNEILQRIARYLMLQTSHQSNLGLLNGKIGITIFFFHYSVYTNKKIYRDFAGELIDEVYNEISGNFLCDFKNGLSGIAWGMEYFIRNHFVEGNSYEVLKELDKQILERDVRRIEDISLDTGLKGLAYYVISRCASRDIKNGIITQNYILDLINSLKLITKEDRETIRLIEDLNSILNFQKITFNSHFFDIILKKTKFNNDTLFEINRPLGISNNGYAGVGLNIIKKG